MPNSDPADLIEKLSESYRQIRFGRGVVGKTGHAALGVLAIWLTVAWRITGNFLADAALLSVGAAATGIFVWWTRSVQKFAKENPAQALLEGAELLEYQKFEAQAKGIPVIKEGKLVEGNSLSAAAVEDRRQ